jgi:hypothetical protein
MIRRGPWTALEDQVLRDLAESGNQLERIAERLERSVGSVRMRASRFKIKLATAGKLKGCPAWLQLSEDRTGFVFLPDRARIVRRIFELSAAGLGGYTIAKQLNAEGISPFGPSPKWDQSTIHNMLSSRATLGEYVPRRYTTAKERPSGNRDRKGVVAGDGIPDYYPAAIDETLFDAAQEARRNNLASGRGRKGPLITNLFGRIPTCGYCRAPVKFHSNGAAKSLICSTVLQDGACYRTGWSYRDFENSFFELIKKLEADSTVERDERKAISEVPELLSAISGQDVYRARLALSMKLKTIVRELTVLTSGPSPVPTVKGSRIRRDQPGRCFELTLKGGLVPRRFTANK